MRQPKILIIAGSVRSGSHNAQLAACLHKVLAQMDCDPTRLNLKDYELPLYDGDLESDKGIPENAMKLARHFDAHDGILLVSPEYNGSTPPLMKNTLDWISRVSKDKDGRTLSPYKGTTFAIGSASPGRLGGIRSLSHLRDILTSVGGTVIAEQISVPGSGDAFDDNDALKDERAASFMNAACSRLVDTAKILSMKSL